MEILASSSDMEIAPGPVLGMASDGNNSGDEVPQATTKVKKASKPKAKATAKDEKEKAEGKISPTAKAKAKGKKSPTAKAKAKGKTAPTRYHKLQMIRADAARQQQQETKKRPATEMDEGDEGSDSSSSSVRDKDKMWHFNKFLENGELPKEAVDVWESLQKRSTKKRKFQTKVVNDMIYKDDNGKWRFKKQSKVVTRYIKRFVVNSKEDAKVTQSEI